MVRAYIRKTPVVNKPIVELPVIVGDRNTESKRDRFYRIIEPRVRRCIHDIGLLGYGADRNRYDPTDRDTDAMERELLKAVADLMALYRSKSRAGPTFQFAREPEHELV